jgi:hypothetical protein
MQKDFETNARVDANTKILADIAKVYGKTMSVTEAFPVTSNLWTDAGYSLLLHQLTVAKQYKCPEFCCFIKYDQPNRNYDKLAFISHGKVHPKWNIFADIIKANAPKFKLIEDDDMKLELLKRGSRGNQVQWLQEILEIEYGYENAGEFDGLFGKLTEDQVKTYQAEAGVAVDGIVGKDTTTELVNGASNPDEWFRKLKIYVAFQY